MPREGGCGAIRQAHLIAVALAFLIGCAVVLPAVGCAGTRSEAPQEEQGRSPKATDSKEARCEGTQTYDFQTVDLNGDNVEAVVTTNDLPGCPKGGLLSGTDKADNEADLPEMLDGGEGDDEVRGLGGSDALAGGKGNDVLYGGPGPDYLQRKLGRDEPDEGDDVLYGGAGDDVAWAYEGEDVLYGGDGDDLLTAAESRGQLDGQRDKLYCGKGKDLYYADKNDYVDSSCEKIDPFAEGAGA
jgi:RTX calcium-binding nonapeptide repeat (4 copies)